jgi:hypothetical protein
MVGMLLAIAIARFNSSAGSCAAAFNSAVSSL